MNVRQSVEAIQLIRIEVVDCGEGKDGFNSSEKHLNNVIGHWSNKLAVEGSSWCSECVGIMVHNGLVLTKDKIAKFITFPQSTLH